MKRISHRVLSPRHLKEASTCCDRAARNFSASSRRTSDTALGGPSPSPPRWPSRCAGPGPEDARLGPSRGYAEEDAPPLPGPSASSLPPSPRPKAGRGSEAPRPPPASPVPGPEGLSRLQARPAAAGAWRCHSRSGRKLGRVARGRPGSFGRLSSPPGTYPAAATAAPRPPARRPQREGKWKRNSARRGLAGPRAPSALPLQAGARRLRGATRLGPDRARRASGPRAGAASKGNSTPFQLPAPPAGHAPSHAPRRHARRPRPPASAPRRCFGLPARPAASALVRHVALAKFNLGSSHHHPSRLFLS